MQTIDQRILIPASPDQVWRMVSDLAENIAWQVDCESIAFLSSRRTGEGVRWRYRTDNGREYVAETTAWYDRLGYEYTFIDGTPFSESKGRLRLQEIAEGTIVQWTFSYEVGGLLSGLRDALSHKRRIEGDMIESLRTLWLHFRDANYETGQFQARSVMRDAPDAEARANYQPRHPSTYAERYTPPPIPAVEIDEPPVADEDTRPNEPITTGQPATNVSPESDSAPQPAMSSSLTIDDEAVDVAEPDFLERLEPTTADLPPVATTSSVTQDAETHVSPEPTPPSSMPSVKAEPLDAIPERRPPPTPPQIDQVTQPLTTPPVTTPRQKPDIVHRSNRSASGADAPVSNNADVDAPSSAASIQEPPTKPVDTSEISVFDVFGLQKPSETQELKALTEEDIASPKSEPHIVIEDSQGIVIFSGPERTGLRILMRRERARVRRPRPDRNKLW